MSISLTRIELPDHPRFSLHIEDHAFVSYLGECIKQLRALGSSPKMINHHICCLGTAHFTKILKNDLSTSLPEVRQSIKLEQVRSSLYPYARSTMTFKNTPVHIAYEVIMKFQTRVLIDAKH